ncbi:MAG TPA: HEAT repeat domain-containing protein [Allosphingosinicella sp.]|jgi:HEAT repeat protein
MLGYMLFVAALFFCAGIAMWLCLLGVRAAKLLHAERRARQRQGILAAMTRFRMAGDPRRLVDGLRQAEPAALIQIASRLLPLFTRAEREAFEEALARRRVARFIAERIARADEAKRTLYCELLGVLGSERSIPTLQHALSDRSPAVRIAAAISLAQRGEVDDVRELVARIGPAARRSSRLTYLFDALLAAHGDEVRAIASDPSIEPRVRISAFVALTGVSEADHRALLPDMAADPSPSVAAASARLLAERPHPDAGPLIARLIESPYPSVRREAAEAASQLGDTGLRPALRRVLGDRDPLVQASAARSLVHLADGAPAGGAPGVARAPALDRPIFGASNG